MKANPVHICRLTQADVDCTSYQVGMITIPACANTDGSLFVYPTPSDGMVQLCSTSLGSEAPAYLECRNAQGRLVHSEGVTALPGDLFHTLDLS